MKKVYLAGPITGLSWGESEDWRNEIKRMVTDSGLPVQLFSPLRGKDYLQGETQIKDSYGQHQMSTAKSIMLRDHFDVETSSALIVNFMNAKRVSIGTVMEIAWAYERRIPVILIMEEEGNVHEHSMLNEAVWWRVQTLEGAVHCLNLLFNP